MKTLNPQQLEACDKILTWLNDEENQFFKLVGYAGTGKSFLLKSLLPYLPLNLIICAPTHKACSNIREIIQDDFVEIRTIASLLSIKPDKNPDEKTGQIKFKQGGKSLKKKLPIQYDLIIIDEAFMLSEYNFELLLKESGTDNKILFIGDNAQLPPINEKESKVNKLDCPNHQLTEVVRYNGKILELATELRNNPIYDKKIINIETSDDLSIIRLKSESAFNRLINSVDWNETKILSYTNKNVNQFNKIIHNYIYGENSYPYIEGEKLIAKTPIIRQINKTENIILANSEEITIKKIIGEHENTEYFLKYIIIKDDEEREFYLLHPSSQLIFDEYLSNFKNQKNWKGYYKLLNTFDDLQLSYALTVHKAQGSGYKNIILDLNSFYKCKNDLQKLQYTALTRVKERLYVL
jgi:ATP-dependent exoDNAse (exonuclease V) alpha subunit